MRCRSQPDAPPARGVGTSIPSPAGGLWAVGLSFIGLSGLVSGMLPSNPTFCDLSNAICCCCCCAPPRRYPGTCRTLHHHPKPWPPSDLHFRSSDSPFGRFCASVVHAPLRVPCRPREAARATAAAARTAARTAGAAVTMVAACPQAAPQEWPPEHAVAVAQAPGPSEAASSSSSSSRVGHGLQKAPPWRPCASAPRRTQSGRGRCAAGGARRRRRTTAGALATMAQSMALTATHACTNVTCARTHYCIWLANARGGGHSGATPPFPKL